MLCGKTSSFRNDSFLPNILWPRWRLAADQMAWFLDNNDDLHLLLHVLHSITKRTCQETLEAPVKLFLAIFWKSKVFCQIDKNIDRIKLSQLIIISDVLSRSPSETRFIHPTKLYIIFWYSVKNLRKMINNGTIIILGFLSLFPYESFHLEMQVVCKFELR